MSKRPLSMIAETFAHEAYNAELEGKTSKKTLAVKEEGEKELSLKISTAKAILLLRSQLLPVAKVKLDSLPFETQIAVAENFAENWEE